MPARPRIRPRSAFLPALVALVALASAACGGAHPTASPVESVAPSAALVAGAAGAAGAVRAVVPLFDGVQQEDPNLIGQGTFWTAVPAGDGWTVTFETGWGDCQAGCIDRHTWTWTVAADGSLTFVGEAGSPVPQDGLDALRAASTRTGVAGRAAGGPTCPVERPGDLACEPRPVGGTDLAVQDASGAQVATVRTDGSGYFRLALAPGAYTLVAPVVPGFMGTPAPMPFTVKDGAEAWLDVAWDTGIR